MKLRILWLYDDVMDLYGDSGNIIALQYRTQKRGIDCEVVRCRIGEQADMKTFDLVFLGGGADREQQLIMKDLKQRKQAILEALKERTFFFLICGGYQLFGQSYVASDGCVIEGLGIYDYTSRAGEVKQRCVGNIIVEAHVENHTMVLVGFENHGGQTYGVKQPFAKVLLGHGNNHKEHMEGFYNGQVLGTYLHGPLLPKNPDLADFIIYKALCKQNPTVNYEDLIPLDDTLEEQARNTLLRRFLR